MLPQLPVAVFRLDYQLSESPSLPPYAGSTWRGAFGHALKRTVCVTRNTACGECMLYRTCAYPYIFETPPPPDAAKMRHYTAAPHPFVLTMEPAQPDLSYRLGLTLLGRAQRYLPYVIHALAKAGEQGLGKKRQPFTLRSVQQATETDLSSWQDIYRPGQPLSPCPSAVPALPAVPPSVRIEIETPLRLRRNERYVTPESFQFADLFGSLLRRISLLTYFNTDTPLETDFAGLSRLARAVRLMEPALRWQDWTRYSSRQQTTLEMGGIVGRFRLDGEAVADFWPYLWLGQWTHAGKGATMGLGRYRIVD
jgi:hypothetical protein